MLHRRSIARWKPRGRCEILGCTATHVTFRILGRLEALVDGRHLDLSSRRERALLGVLLLHVDEVVSVEALIDSVWGEAAPAYAVNLVQKYVSGLRRAFEPVRSVRSPSLLTWSDVGYRLSLPPGCEPVLRPVGA